MKRLKSATCIAAIKNKKGKIFIAADRRVSWGAHQAQSMINAKVIKRDGLILAGTGDSFLCDIFTRIMLIPERKVENTDTYIHEQFYKQIKKTLDHKGLSDKDGSLKIPVELEVELLIALDNRLYSLVVYNPDPETKDSHGLIIVDELALPYATGCGGQLAWGSLLTTENMSMTPKERLIIALKVAAEVSPGCNDKIDIENE